jgi:hypothetical protein
MATAYNSKIITDDLSLCLDVSNPKSYSGGSTWKDLANGIEFASSGTQTPIATREGIRCFDFNGSGYWSSQGGTSQSDKVDMGGDCTLIIWLYSEDVTVRKTIFEKAGTIGTSYQQEIAVTWETSEAWSYYSRISNYDYAGSYTAVIGKWNMMAIKMSTGRTATARTGFRSLNGSAWNASYTSRSSSALTSAGAVRVGTGYAGTVAVGAIGSVLCYNKMLDDDEILHNYNATKGKFGI